MLENLVKQTTKLLSNIILTKELVDEIIMQQLPWWVSGWTSHNIFMISPINYPKKEVLFHFKQLPNKQLEYVSYQIRDMPKYVQ